jgi:hypothetical protein
MAKVKQLTVSLKNRPGVLDQLAKTLADAKINVVALLGSSAGVQGSAPVCNDSQRSNFTIDLRNRYRNRLSMDIQPQKSYLFH